MSYGSGSQMIIRCKTATLTLFLVVLLGCHAFSAHCGRELDGGGGDGQTGHEMLKPLPGKCVKSTCVAADGLDSKSWCFCCLSTPESPCFGKEADCVKVCRPEVLPPPAGAGSGGD
uniref:Uncharacterized protein n=1 Tax=Avena sativa TaxID=4498 RepID=A0ACD5YDR9_AVESA